VQPVHPPQMLRARAKRVRGSPPQVVLNRALVTWSSDDDTSPAKKNRLHDRHTRDLEELPSPSWVAHHMQEEDSEDNDDSLARHTIHWTTEEESPAKKRQQEHTPVQNRGHPPVSKPAPPPPRRPRRPLLRSKYAPCISGDDNEEEDDEKYGAEQSIRQSSADVDDRRDPMAVLSCGEIANPPRAVGKKDSDTVSEGCLDDTEEYNSPSSASGPEGDSSPAESDMTQRGVAKGGYVDTQPRKARCKAGKQSMSPGSFTAMSDQRWKVEQHGGDGSPYATIIELGSGASFNVHYNRVPKAKIRLSYDDCANAVKMGNCDCSRGCHKTLTNIEDIRRLRTEVFKNCDNGPAVMNLLVAKLNAHGGAPTILKEKGQYTPVCRKYYAAVHGISENSVKKASRLSKNGARAPSAKYSMGARDKPKYEVSYAFWNLFFEQNCQKPNDEVRLFPVAKPMKDIYTIYFKPWFARLVSRGDRTLEDMPGFGTWKKARWAPEFADVKRRAKHTHARCGECSRLKQMMLNSFQDGAEERNYLQQRRLHDAEVEGWRKLEEVSKAAAVNNPQDNLCIMHDGTSALGLPRLSQRTIKNLDPTRLEVTPWLAMDYSAGLKDYIYSQTEVTAKGANTLISQIHIVIRRAKSDYKHPRHRARKMCMIADSASENKNNILLAYCTDLVDNGWFDEIQLLFGPVGHTHNGVDATHKIHNVNVACYISGDLGQFVQNYVKGFSGLSSTASQTPTASILAETLDWTAYYSPVIRKISGFTNTKKDSIPVRGFKIAKNKNGTTDVKWKVDPAIEKEWRGAGGHPHSPGFFLLKSTPVGLPAFVQRPAVTEAMLAMAKKLRKKNMQAVMASEGLQACVDWNYKAAMTGKIPIHRYLEDATPTPEWGRLAEIGAIEGKRGLLRIIDEYWDSTLPQDRAALWSLPICPNNSHLAATQNIFHFSADQALLKNRPLPRVRYLDEQAHNCEVAHHENNIDGGWRREDGQAENKEREEAPSEAKENKERDEGDAGHVAGVAEKEWFEEDFKGCKPKTYCVGIGRADPGEGPTPYIFVGIITAVAKKARTFQVKRLKCTKDPWTKECLKAEWYSDARAAVMKCEHYAVMAYFTKLTAKGRLPETAKTKVGLRKHGVWST
jgi:hypothetical protein